MLPKFCTRDEEDPSTEFDSVFHRNLQEKDYNWYGCGVDVGEGPPPGTPSQLPDFRIVPDPISSPSNSPGKLFTSSGTPSNSFYIIKQPDPSLVNDSLPVEPTVSTTADECEDVPILPRNSDKM
jgi:hypothetical protein